MRFGESHWLWLLALLPFLAAGLALALRRRERALRAWCDAGLLARMVPGRSARAPWLRAGLVVLAALFLVLTAARPQMGSRVLAVERKGIDVVVALDLSESMRAEDLRPDRLTRARQGVESLLDRLRGDRVGLVGFAGDAFVQCPLTLDYAAARMFLRLMTPEMIPVPGTDLGAAVRTAVKAFDPKERKYKALVLITDGEDHGHDLDAAVREAKEQGVRIFAVGIGSEKGEPIPERDASGQVRDYKRDSGGEVVMTRLDPDVLKKICAETDGRYFDGNAGGLALDRLYAEISGMEQKEQKGGIALQYEDRYSYFAAAAFLLLAIESLLAERRGARNGRRRDRAADGVLRHPASPGVALLILVASLLLPGGAEAGDPGGRAYRKGDYAAARDAYAAYAREHPDDPRGEYNLGTALNRAGEIPPAQESFLRAMRSRDPGLRAAALYNLGNTRVKAGDLPGAAEAYEMALRQRPGDRDAKYNLELVRALMQKQPPDSSGKNQQQDQKQKQDQKNQKNQQNQQGKQNQQNQQKNQDQQGKQDQQKSQDQQQQQQQQQNDKDQQQADQQQARENGQSADSTDAQPDMQPARISPEQARQILEGLAQQEMMLQQERLRARSRPLKVEKDW